MRWHQISTIKDKHAQSCGSLELIAFIFIIFLLCMSFFKSAVIQGDFWERTRLVRIGTFFISNCQEI